MFLKTPSYSLDRAKLEDGNCRLVFSWEAAREIAKGWEIVSSAPLKQRGAIRNIDDDGEWISFVKSCDNAVQYKKDGSGDVECVDMKAVLDHCYELAFCIPLSPKGRFDRKSPSLFAKSHSSGQSARIPVLEI